MKKIVGAVFLSVFFLSACQPTESTNHYRNEAIGIAFENPEGWPEPILQEGGLSYGAIGSMLPEYEVDWTLKLGKIEKGFCEGSDCSLFSFIGFPDLDYSEVLTTLQNHSLTEVLEEKTVNGNKVIIYTSGGICGDLAAVIFSGKKVVQYQHNCGGEERKTNETLERIISSLKFL